MAQVVLKELNKKYDEVHAVKDVNLTIRDKEFMVLVGPSGCGKTTTLRMVAGLEEITSGEIAIGDRIVNDLPPKDRDIAMVFQNYALYPHMSVYDNMAFGLKLRGMKKDRRGERVNGAAKTLGLAEVLPKKPRTLSGGQRQRVAMGRAIVRDPTIFRTELWEVGGVGHDVHFYDVSVEDVIWGATARILKQFLDIVDGREEAA